MAHIGVQETLSLALNDVKVRKLRENCLRLVFETSRGKYEGILHHKDGNRAGTVLVGGAGGGLDGPASIYRDMGEDLLDEGISSLRIDYRYANHLEECILDTLLGIEYLKDLGITSVGVVGWSFGGAVAIGAGAESDVVRAVATVASQTFGTDAVSRLAPKALLLIHGTGDKTLPPACSDDIYSRAGEPKELVLFKGANHGIDQNRDEMLKEIEGFFRRQLL